MTARNPKTSTQTILGNVMKILAPRLDPHGVQAGLFAEALYSSAVPEALSDMDSQALEGIALSLFDFVRRRTPGQAKVRAYTPNRNDHGWASSHSVVEIVNDDMPFLVDSVVAALNRRNLIVHLLIHPIMMIRREGDAVAEIVAVQNARDAKFRPESVMHIQIDQQPSAAASFQGFAVRASPVTAESRIASAMATIIGATAFGSRWRTAAWIILVLTQVTTI